ncbi:hypothetical protein SARC_06134 [Sphaeroforma arctica JP610]|uniref:Ricin B lectin domain-containing protein n=1 Tax=Sphaeroforma arctica JP610 TaxID=667725 RepID=A0A0L0FY33_9EUKA|nr:hypothetical protein SARC_06134 [Sphaeroforma arctica JP610]KNC81544.1 hypothetical protein SARC_06134 [Sphaeroforma arctica JP610]|eukprot:XP_014155446.1 hypothetical protein SARC_06134 [Sphaeroforma arctica JP610]
MYMVMVQSTSVVSFLVACALLNTSTAAPVHAHINASNDSPLSIERRAVLDGNGNYYSLRNRYHPECLNADLNIKKGVHTGECNTRDTLYVRYMEDDETIRTHHDWCLGMGKTEEPDGTESKNMEVQECNGSEAQKWMAPNYDGQRHLESKSEHLCADVEHQHWKAEVILWNCKSINSYKFLNQQWISFGRMVKDGKADFVVQEMSESTVNGMAKRVA